jgi:hypothetical protein
VEYDFGSRERIARFIIDRPALAKKKDRVLLDKSRFLPQPQY